MCGQYYSIIPVWPGSNATDLILFIHVGVSRLMMPDWYVVMMMAPDDPTWPIK